MSFPTTSILDPFVGYGVGGLNPTDPNWSTGFLGLANLRLNDVSANSVNATANFCGDYYSAAQFGPDTEVYCDVVRADTLANIIGLYLRVTNPATPGSYDYYDLQIDGTGAWNWGVATNGARSSIGTATQVVATGDKVGFSAVGTTLTGWWNNHTTGLWTSVGTVTNGTWSGSGYTGLLVQGSVNPSTWVLTNYGGGTAVAAPTGPQVLVPMSVSGQLRN